MANIFYMPSPDVFGVWPADGGVSEYIGGVSVFKFAQDDGSRNALFKTCEDETASKAILGGLRRGWTSAVCNSIGFAPANTVSITTSKAGVAELQDDGTWKMKSKATINFKE